jgi:hypothetical protein
MPTTRGATLKVPGASLHYEVQGSGPVPGDHEAVTSHPDAFAELLQKVLRGS